jgi:Ku protein
MAASVWKGHLTFGMVSFPIRLFSAARSETISFNMLHKDDHSRIRQVTYCALEDKPIARTDTVKGYEYEKDHYVVIDEEDIKKVAPKTAKVMEILEFVKADQVDPIYLESSYYVAPDEGGEKAYALLFQALRESSFYAVAKVAMHNREHIIVLRPGSKGILSHTMYYQDEIRQVEEFRRRASPKSANPHRWPRRRPPRNPARSRSHPRSAPASPRPDNLRLHEDYPTFWQEQRITPSSVPRTPPCPPVAPGSNLIR